MVFPVVGGTQDTGYEISNSLRFNDDDSAKLGKDFSSTETSDKTKTLSFWIKRSTLGQEGLIRARTDSEDENTRTIIYFASDDSLQVQSRVSGSGATLSTNRLFRDVSAWYHLVFAFDTSQGTASNRLKIYVNGVEETSFAVDERSNISQNREIQFGNNKSSAESFIGNEISDLGFYDGYISEFNFIDGQQLDASYFGETNDNGVWIPKQYTGTYGNNGFFLEFKQTGTSANASGIGADTSGNDHHFTPTNLAATDVTTDTPTNNFCTMNPLMSFAGASDGIDAFSEGNTVVDSNNDTSAAGATFGVNNGKWYYEAKLTTGNQSSTNFSTGWCQVDYEGQKGTGNGVGFMSGEDNASTDVGGNIIWNNSGNGNQATFGNRSTNDIFQVALDLDNHKMWFGVNGTWSNGSSSQSTTFNANSPDFSDIFDTAGVYYMPAFAQGSTGQTVLAYNFGNPSFAISSGNADANGYGNFEYAVPSGFYSLCTKNLAEYG